MRLATAALALLAVALPASAQGRWLDTFAVPGVYGGGPSGGASVNAAVPDGEGVLVGGTFRTVDGTEVNSIARWTGTAWEAFGGGVRRGGSPGIVGAVLRDASGAVWVTGAFDRVVQPDGSSIAAGGLARWVGARWTVPAFLVGLDTPGGGYALLEEGGSVYVAGQFFGVDTGGGVRTGGGGLVRWMNGQFNAVPRSPADVFALAAAPGGGVLFASGVPQPDGTAAVVIVRTDGQNTPQSVTSPLYGPNRVVRALRAEADGIVVGGEFEGGRAADGSAVPSRNVIRWDGAAWQPFGRGVTGGEVLALVNDPTGGLLVGGVFSRATNADGSTVAARWLARWSGAAWQSIPDVTGIYPDGSVATLARRGGETVVGGVFAAQSGRGATTVRSVGLTRLTADGETRPLSARTGRDGTFIVNGSEQIVRLASDGCGGAHVVAPEQAGPLPETGRGVFRRWTGTAWAPVPEALRTTILRNEVGLPTGTVIDVVGVPGTCDAFVVAGFFGSVNAGGTVTASAYVARWNGTAWQPLGRGTGNRAYTAVVAADGAVTVGGTFSTVIQANGTAVPVRSVARWTDAAGWSPFGGGVGQSGTPGDVFALLPEADGSVVVGGHFNAVYDAGGAARAARGLARWTGAAWETFGGPIPDVSPISGVSSITLWQGLLVIGGDFRQVAQPSGAVLDSRSVATWDGTAWRALPGLTTPVIALAVLDGTLVASDGLDGRTARWTGTAWVPLGPDGPGSIYGIAAAGRRLYASGPFDTAGGIGSPGLSVFDLDAASPAEASPETASGALHVYPNPSRTSATLAFRLDATGSVRLTLVDALGRTVAVLHDGELAAGEQTVRVDTSRLPAGVYVARLDAGGRVEARRITVVR